MEGNTGGWNPRYVQFAKAHGMTPDEMAAIQDRDRQSPVNDPELLKWRGGFHWWIMSAWNLFDKDTNDEYAFYSQGAYCTGKGTKVGHTTEGHKKFDEWLPQAVAEKRIVLTDYATVVTKTKEN
jgi:hypothetical protein